MPCNAIANNLVVPPFTSANPSLETTKMLKKMWHLDVLESSQALFKFDSKDIFVNIWKLWTRRGSEPVVNVSTYSYCTVLKNIGKNGRSACST